MIICQALTERSLYVSANGNILPCCYQNMLVTDEENFESLVESWTSESPNKKCFDICDDGNQNNAVSIIHFKNQWKLNDTEN